jgi:NADH-quinone oxidoreductase subunit J
MEITFYIAAVVAIFSTVMVITRLNAVHALLYLIVSLLSVAVIFFTLGAPFIAALEVIIYAGAIMVLFIFVIMMLNLGNAAKQQESQWLKPSMWIGPSILSIIILFELLFALSRNQSEMFTASVIDARQVGAALFGPYLIAVELAAMLLLAGIVGAYHLGRRKKASLHRFTEGMNK